MNENKKINIKELLSNDKAKNVFIIIGIAAMFLIFISSQFSASDNKEMTDSLSVKSYRESLTSDLLQMVLSVEGAGDAKVLVTLDTSYEYVYLDDGKTLQKINEPTVRGVVVACSGGDSSVVCEEITTMLTTVLGISSNNVCITKLT